MAFLGVIALLMLGYAGGYVLHTHASVVFEEVCDERFELLSPYLRCDPNETRKREYAAFKRRIEDFIRGHIALGNVKTVSVYFRDLQNGPWFGIDEQAAFSPASMMKLPVLVAYYRVSEDDPGFLTEKISADGTTYTIEELLRRMIVDSDNTAFELLFTHLIDLYPDQDPFSETLSAMGLAASEGSEDDFLTVKRYASIYRILYNASYLNKEMSQRALKLLTESRSPEGIASGVPPNTVVAHKFGIREHPDSLQLHDCGIVYHPENHYMICIMTKGRDIETLSRIIADITAMVHAEVELRVGENGGNIQ